MVYILDGALEAAVMSSYSVILADPPWAFDNVPPRRNAAAHYRGSLSVPSICQLPIKPLVARQAALFLWVTMVHLEDAFSVMQAWGFKYRTCAFAWTKVNRDGTPFMGMGNYTRANTELCLLGLRGHPKPLAKNIPQAILARRRQHSRKPDEQYDRIMRLFDGPYLELFARQQWPGWDVWGNETGKYPSQPFLLKEFAS